MNHHPVSWQLRWLGALRSPAATKLFTLLATGALAAAVLKALFDAGMMLLPHARGALENDVLIYFTIARGMLNGLAPYRDLFESKPPGMFLLAWTSLVTTGGPGLITVADILALSLLPALLMALALWHPGGAPGWRQKAIAAALGLLLGVQLALYLEQRANPAQTEIFGSFFGAVYVLHVLWTRASGRPRAVLINAALLLATVGLKEPFLLTTFAAVLLVVEHPRDLVRAFLLPLTIAGVAGLLGLALLGAARDYFAIYLPAMLQQRVTANPVEPFYVRSFAVAKILYNVTVAYTAPGFGVLLAVLWLTVAFVKRPGGSVRDLAAGVGLAGAGYFLLSFTWVMAVFLYAVMLFHVEWDVPFFATKLAEYLGLAAVLALLLFTQRKRRMGAATLVAMASLLPVAAAVGVAGYANQHWAFAGPYYFALLLLFIRHVSGPQPSRILVGIGACLTLVTVFAYRPSLDHVQYVRGRLDYNRERQQEAVRRLDGLLDACGVDRYVSSTSVFQRLAFARHSPLGPIFDPNFHTYLKPDHPLLQASVAAIQRDGRVAVVPAGAAFEAPFAQALAPFTKDVPACARPFLPIAGIDVWFRDLGPQTRP